MEFHQLNKRCGGEGENYIWNIVIEMNENKVTPSLGIQEDS